MEPPSRDPSPPWPRFAEDQLTAQLIGARGTNFRQMKFLRRGSHLKNQRTPIHFCPVHHFARISGNFPSVNCNRCVDSVCSGKLISEEINWLSTQSNIRYMNSTRIRRRFTVSIFVTYLTFQKKPRDFSNHGVRVQARCECRFERRRGLIAFSGFSRYYTSCE